VKREANQRRIAARSEQLLQTLRRVQQRHPHADPDNIRHTLLLLELPPLERLRRGLIRGQTSHLH
jgi:hypothetical protein